jgi:pimeloyl-ACP methyl ester carboxylesterase
MWSDESGPAGASLVALVHGSMDRASGMLRLARVLDHDRRVLRYDRRGYGRSTPVVDGHQVPHPGPFGMDAQVDDLVALLDGRRAVLVGHSYGGNVVLATAARHPHLVEAVALYESPQSWEPWWPGTTAGGEAVASAAAPDEAAERFMRRMIGDAKWEVLPERTRATRRREGSAMVGELADLRGVAPWTAEAVRVPVRAGVGSRASAHQQRGMRHVAASIAGAVLVELQGCGHDAPLSHPALFAEHLVAPLLA